MIRCYIGDNEIKRIIENIKNNEPTYKVEIILYKPITNIENLITLNGLNLILEKESD